MSRRTAILLSLLLAGASPVLAADEAPLSPSYVPDPKSTEGGLWLAAEKAEKDIQQSPLRLQDDAAEAYVKSIVCKLLPAQCQTLRVYIVEDPTFNANVRANGSVVIYTGLLLRLENEAQLAAVLGHEITHYLNHHVLKNVESWRDTGNAFAFFSLGLAGVGVGYNVNLSSVGDLTRLIAVGALFSYGRGQETEADTGGLQLSQSAGYDPHQVVAVWKDIEAEEAANPNRKTPSLFYASHPANLDRMNVLSKRIDADTQNANAAFVGTEEYRAAFSRFRAHWLEGELNTAQYDKTLFMLGRLVTASPSDALLRFYQGEAYRRRNAKGDLQNSLKSYRDAVALNDVPAAAYRGLGLAALKSGDKASAHEAFARYLNLLPAADDRAMVETYLANSEP